MRHLAQQIPLLYLGITIGGCARLAYEGLHGRVAGWRSGSPKN